MRGRLEDTNEDISAVTVTVKDEDGAGVSGGMFVFRDALVVQAAKTAGMLVDLTDECVFVFGCGGSCGTLASDAKEDPSDDYHGAIRPDGALRRVFVI